MDIDSLIDIHEDIRRIEGIISAMTPHERLNPDRIDASRCQRIARGSAVHSREVERLLREFQGMSRIMQKMSGLGHDRLQRLDDLVNGFSPDSWD